MSKVHYLPEGYNCVTPCLIIAGAAKAIDFYQQVLGAKELMRFEGPGGKIAHAEIQIGTSRIMLADECSEINVKSPKSLGGSSVAICVYLENVDSIFDAAIKHGSKVVRPVADQFYGDRSGSFTDPFGHNWTVATHVEDVTPEEMEKRVRARMEPA